MPEFEKVFTAHESTMLRDAYDAITQCELWDWLRTYSPEDNKGFMFSTHPNLERINKAMKYEGHSGSSYAMTMRVMEKIAKEGFDSLKCARPSACPCRSAKGYMSGWCGVAGGGVPACDH